MVKKCIPCGRQVFLARRGNGRASVFIAGCVVSALIFGLMQFFSAQIKHAFPNLNMSPSPQISSNSTLETTAPVHSDAKAPGKERLPAEPTTAQMTQNGSVQSTPKKSTTVSSKTTARVPSVLLPTLSVSGTADSFDKEALATAKMLVERYPNRAEALHTLALLEAQMRHSAEADRLWRKCIELAPGEDIYLTNLAANSINRGDSEGAIEFLSTLAEKGKASPDALHNYAASLMNVGRLDEALKIIQEATQRATKSPSHWLLYGQIQLKRGEAAEAESHIRRAIELGGETNTSCFNLASALARQGKKDEAAEYRRRYKELTDSESSAETPRYEVLSAVESRKNLITVLIEAGAIYGKNGDTLKAESLLLRALALDPRELSAATSLADLYFASNMFSEERVARRRIQELTPSDFEAYLRLAKASVNAGEPEAGAAVLKNALALAPDRVDGYASLAQLYMANQEPHKALFYAKEAVALQPSREGYQFLASIYTALSQPAEAAAAQAQAAKLGSPPK